MTDRSKCSILLVTLHFPPEKGAAATRLDALTRRWAEMGHDVTVLTSTPDFPDGDVYEGYQNDWLSKTTQDQVTVLTTKTLPAASDDALLKRALKYALFTILTTIVGTLYMDRRDVVLATSPQPFAGLAGYLIARRHGSPFVFEVRDLWPESLTAMGEVTNPAIIRILSTLSAFLYTHADRVSVVTPGMKQYVVEQGASPDDVWLNMNGIDSSTFAPDSDCTVDETRLFDNHFIISYVGTVGKAQGLEVVLDVADTLQQHDRYDDIRFVFIGFGSRYEQLRTQAEANDLDNIVFLGRRPPAQIPCYLNNSDVAFIHTAGDTVFETAIPMKLYEALGTGLPVVLGVSGDAATLMQRAQAGIPVPPGDAPAITDAIQTLYLDDDLRAEYAKNGRDYAVRNHSWDAIARDFSHQLRGLVSGTG